MGLELDIVYLKSLLIRSCCFLVGGILGGGSYQLNIVFSGLRMYKEYTKKQQPEAKRLC